MSACTSSVSFLLVTLVWPSHERTKQATMMNLMDTGPAQQLYSYETFELTLPQTWVQTLGPKSPL